MITGYVNEALEPVIEIGLKAADGLTQIAAVVDTGFSGELCLSEHLIDHLEMEFAFVERYELANGDVLVEDVYRGTIEFDGYEREVDLILTASTDSLIGASLLQAYTLNIDYPRRTVQIAQVLQ
jgi:clan AA aspartic protease